MRRDEDIYGLPTVEGPLFDGDPFARSEAAPSVEEAEVAREIWRHKGRRNPVAIARLSAVTGYPERHIKGIVEQLVVKHKMRIGGRREAPSGYFVIEDGEDLAAAVRPYRAQIRSMWQRLRVLESAAALEELKDQLEV